MEGKEGEKEARFSVLRLGGRGKGQRVGKESTEGHRKQTSFNTVGLG